MDDNVVAAVLSDWRTAPIDDQLRALLGFLEKLVLAPAEVGPADAELVRATGLSDQAIEEAIYVSFIFNVVNRMADAFDFQIPSPQGQGKVADFLFKFGYGTGSVPG